MSDVPKILPKKTTLHEDTLEDLFRAPREESNPYNSEITYREYESDFMWYFLLFQLKSPVVTRSTGIIRFTIIC